MSAMVSVDWSNQLNTRLKPDDAKLTGELEMAANGLPIRHFLYQIDNSLPCGLLLSVIHPSLEGYLVD